MAAQALAPIAPSRAIDSHHNGLQHALASLSRTTEFWRRATTIYGSYKVTQLKEVVLRAAGKSPEELKDTLWREQHTWAGQQMYELAVSMRGFYLKVRRGGVGGGGAGQLRILQWGSESLCCEGCRRARCREGWGAAAGSCRRRTLHDVRRGCS